MGPTTLCNNPFCMHDLLLRVFFSMNPWNRAAWQDAETGFTPAFLPILVFLNIWWPHQSLQMHHCQVVTLKVILGPEQFWDIPYTDLKHDMCHDASNWGTWKTLTYNRNKLPPKNPVFAEISLFKTSSCIWGECLLVCLACLTLTAQNFATLATRVNLGLSMPMKVSSRLGIPGSVMDNISPSPSSINSPSLGEVVVWKGFVYVLGLPPRQYSQDSHQDYEPFLGSGIPN